MPVPQYFTLEIVGDKNKLGFDFTSNKQVKTYNSDDSVACDLSLVETDSCEITYRIEVISTEDLVTTI